MRGLLVDLGNFSKGQWSVVPIRPLTHGAVVISGPPIAQQIEDEHTVRRTDAALSISDDLFFRGHPCRLQHGAKLIGRFDSHYFVFGDKVQPLEVHRIGNSSCTLVATVVGTFPFAICADIQEQNVGIIYIVQIRLSLVLGVNVVEFFVGLTSDTGLPSSNHFRQPPFSTLTLVCP